MINRAKSCQEFGKLLEASGAIKLSTIMNESGDEPKGAMVVLRVVRVQRKGKTINLK